MECKKDRNKEFCGCSHTECGRHGVCCDCLQYHLKNRQLPGCCFPPEVERTDARNFAAFAKAWNL